MKLLNDYLKFTFLVCLSYCIFLPTLQAQGPWLQEKGTGFAQFQTTFGSYNSLFVAELDDLQSINREVSNVDMGLYGTYGITNDLTIIAHVPLKIVSTGATTDSLYSTPLLDEGELFGMSNLYFAAKYKILDKNVKAAVSVQSHWNTASEDLGKGLATGYLGNSVGFFGHVGGGLDKLYAFADLGYTISGGGYSDYMSLHLEAGYKVVKPLYVIAHVNIRSSRKNGDFDNATLMQTGLHADNQEWVSWGLRLMYETESNWGASIGMAGAFSANYVGAYPPISVGVFRKW